MNYAYVWNNASFQLIMSEREKKLTKVAFYFFEGVDNELLIEKARQ